MANAETDFTGLEKAAGLTYEESQLVQQLVDVFKDRLENNNIRMKYYEDKNQLKNIGLTIPQEIANRVDTHVGWAGRCVDYLAARSQFDSFTGGDDMLGELLQDNNFSVEYSKAVPSQLVSGVGFWTISRGAEGEPKAIINFKSATSAAALWDWRRKTIKAGFVVEDYRIKNGKVANGYEPSLVVLHTDKAVLEIKRGEGDRWTAERKPHVLGRPMMVSMAYKPQDTKPFGKSRISKTVMGITDEMQRQIMRMSIHSEVFSSGQKAILGVSDEQYDALAANKYRAAMSELFMVTRDENGEIPTLTQFQQQSMEPHIKAMEMLMQRMAAETAVPVAEYGLSVRGYQSTDALKASESSIVLEAENLNKTNGQAIVEVAKIAYAVATNETMDRLPDNIKKLSVHWIDPSMPSAASVADATVKLAGAVPEFGGTEVFWEMNGFDEDQRRRVKTDMRMNAGRAALNKMFGGE